MRVVVVGSGVSGLTCGVTLLEHGHDVQIWAASPAALTTSAVAAAVWYPLRGERDARVDGWLPVSYSRFASLAEDPASGIILRSGIELFREPADDTWWRDVLPRFRHASAEELPRGYADAFVAERIPVVEMPLYLAFLVSRFEGLGGALRERAVSSPDEVDADVVVNCAGLGARELARDGSVRAIRGQVVWIEPFGLDRYILDEANPDGVTYICPRSNDVVLGGTREDDVESLDPDPPTAEAIIARCAVLEPRVKAARVLAHRVGLRPGRPSVRLEREGRVVHDYGHGGSGVTLSWGCAAEVAELVAPAERDHRLR